MNKILFILFCVVFFSCDHKRLDNTKQINEKQINLDSNSFLSDDLLLYKDTNCSGALDNFLFNPHRSLNCKNVSGNDLVECFDSNGKLQIATKIKDNKIDSFITFYNDGVKYYHANVKCGKIKGWLKFYYESGFVSEEIYFDEKGELSWNTYYKSGLKSNELIILKSFCDFFVYSHDSWYENGNKHFSVSYDLDYYDNLDVFFEDSINFKVVRTYWNKSGDTIFSQSGDSIKKYTDKLLWLNYHIDFFSRKSNLYIDPFSISQKKIYFDVFPFKLQVQERNKYLLFILHKNNINYKTAD